MSRNHAQLRVQDWTILWTTLMKYRPIIPSEIMPKNSNWTHWTIRTIIYIPLCFLQNAIIVPKKVLPRRTNETHVVLIHPGKPGYQGPADIKFYHLKKQGMVWEQEKSKIDLTP
jgi:hypothetical protein